MTLLAGSEGCSRPTIAPAEAPAKEATPIIAVVKPTRQTIRRLIEQPAYNIEAFQQTPIYAKLTGYVRKVNVDIGESVREGEVLAELWVPELQVELKQKEAAIHQARAEILQAQRMLAAAEANLHSAEAKIKEAESGRLQAKAEFERAGSQFERLSRAGSRGVIDKENVEETRFGLEAARAAQELVEARVQSAHAARDESKAQRDKAEADVAVAQSRLEAATADRDRVQALLGYLKLTAPFAGLVTRRNVDIGHFVQPTAGSGSKGEPLFVVEQTDPVRVFVSVPELDARWIKDGIPARVRVPGLEDEISGTITRSSGALDPRARTLRTEIDLPNHDRRLKPGMYATVAIDVTHADAWTLPLAAVGGKDKQPYCFRIADGKAIRSLLQLGLSDGQRIEVLQIRAPGTAGRWEALTGTEEIAASGVDTLKDGPPPGK